MDSKATINDVQVAEVQRAAALRLLKSGAADRAFAELMHAARAGPLSARVASSLGLVAEASGSVGPALSFLVQRLPEAHGAERLELMRVVARLLRRSGDDARCREYLVQVLAERPEDSRSRFVLNSLLERAGRWEELDASLDRETLGALGRGAFRQASKAALRRARLWAERLEDPARAAWRYGQAAQYAESGGDLDTSFRLRLQWVRCLHQAHTPPRRLDDAVRLLLALSHRLGRPERARALLIELGVTTRPVDPVRSGTARRETVSLPVVANVSAAESHPPAVPNDSSLRATLALDADAEFPGEQEEEEAFSGSAGPAEDPAAQQVAAVEMEYLRRGSWRELADLYRTESQRAADARERAAWLEKLAEVAESELRDLPMAAQAWEAVAASTGDPRAVGEQVRLLARQDDLQGVRAALDAAVQRAPDPEARVRALVLRGEDARARQETASARGDFEEALSLAPGHPAASAGLAEVAAQAGDLAPARALHRVVQALAPHAVGREDLARRLARLADSTAGERAMARSAWSEVLVECPGDAEASARLATIAGEDGDDHLLEQALKAQLAGAPRGLEARQTHLELVALLDRRSRAEEALSALRSAVQAEPSHREAWLKLADRLAASGRDAEAVWALEQGARASADPAHRLELFEQAAQWSRGLLGDQARARTYDERAATVRLQLLEQARSQVVGSPRAGAARTVADEDPFPEALEELSGAHAAIPSGFQEGVVPPHREHPTDEVEAAPATEPPPNLAEEAHHTQELELQDSAMAITSPVEGAQGEQPSRLATHPLALAASEERMVLFERVRRSPLEPEGYRQLAEHFDTANDPSRSSLMLEVARALEGDPHAAPRAPRLMLSAGDRAGLRHPWLRGEAGELIGLVGVALCRLHPARGEGARTRQEFRLDSGRGARAAADALLASVRILGLRAPDVFVSTRGPPFSLAYGAGPRLLVSAGAVRRELKEAELRFFAGRALFTQNPELLALRGLKREDLRQGLHTVASVLRSKVVVGGAPTGLTPEARIVRDAVAPASIERLRALWPRVGPHLDLKRLAEAARHSANRAGLVVCGGVAPALAALRSKRALPTEMIELVRFAASERYLQLRNRRLLPLSG